MFKKIVMEEFWNKHFMKKKCYSQNLIKMGMFFFFGKNCLMCVDFSLQIKVVCGQPDRRQCPVPAAVSLAVRPTVSGSSHPPHSVCRPLCQFPPSSPTQTQPRSRGCDSMSKTSPHPWPPTPTAVDNKPTRMSLSVTLPAWFPSALRSHHPVDWPPLTRARWEIMRIAEEFFGFRPAAPAIRAVMWPRGGREAAWTRLSLRWSRRLRTCGRESGFPTTNLWCFHLSVTAG